MKNAFYVGKVIYLILPLFSVLVGCAGAPIKDEFTPAHIEQSSTTIAASIKQINVSPEEMQKAIEAYKAAGKSDLSENRIYHVESLYKTGAMYKGKKFYVAWKDALTTAINETGLFGGHNSANGISIMVTAQELKYPDWWGVGSNKKIELTARYEVVEPDTKNVLYKTVINSSGFSDDQSPAARNFWSAMNKAVSANINSFVQELNSSADALERIIQN